MRQPPEITTQTPHVYVVDDDAGDRLIVDRLCSKLGVPTRLYASTDDFLQDVGPDSRGCMVTDMLMPTMSGLELHRTLNRRGIPLLTIMLTGYESPKSIEQCVEAGVFRFCPKELSLSTLGNAITIAMQQAAETAPAV